MLNGIKIGWIDFSNKDREKVLSVLRLLSAPGTLDELGIGIIRDGFANKLFPGTSTIQTRAKYFFIVPYILTELEQGKISSSKEFIKQLWEEEINLINQLKQSNANGVIGSVAGKDLKRKPSEIYWNGLRVFEFLKYNKLSLEEYSKAVSLLKSQDNKHFLKRETKDILEDDAEVFRNEIIGKFWNCLTPTNDWRKRLKIELTNEEAYYLMNRILKSPFSSDSLLAHMIKEDIEEALKITDFDVIGYTYKNMNSELETDYKMAKDFSLFIYGANIRYNVMFFNYENKVVNEKWDAWNEEIKSKIDLDSYNANKIFSHLNLKNYRLKRFLEKYLHCLINDDMHMLDNLIKQREIQLKGHERSKLGNMEYSRDVKWIGIGRLDYRLNSAKNIIRDIIQGLGDENVKTI